MAETPQTCLRIRNETAGKSKQKTVCAPAVQPSSLTPNTEHKQELSGPRGAVKPPVGLLFGVLGSSVGQRAFTEFVYCV